MKIAELGSEYHKIPSAKLLLQIVPMECERMASIVEELKGKLAELNARLEAIRAEAVALEGQKAAFESAAIACDTSEAEG